MSKDWNPNASSSKDDLKFVKLSSGEELIGEFVEQKDAKRKDGTDTRWYVFMVDGVKTVISSNAGTLKAKMENAPQGVNMRIIYNNANGKNFFNVEPLYDKK